MVVESSEQTSSHKNDNKLVLLMVLADISSSLWELRTEQKVQTEGKSMYKHHHLACSPDCSMWHAQQIL